MLSKLNYYDIIRELNFMRIERFVTISGERGEKNAEGYTARI